MSLAFTQESDFRKEREFGQKISATFEFIRAHWRPLGRVMLYTVLPAALLYGVLNAILQISMFKNVLEPFTNGKMSGGMRWTATAEIMSSPLYWVNAIMRGAFFSLIILSVYGYLLCCLRGTSTGQAAYPAEEGGGRPAITVADVWTIIKREFVSTYFSTVGIGLLVVLGFMVLFVPGIYLSIMLTLFYITKLVEGTSFGETVSRCWQLIQGKWWSTFGLIFVMMLLLYALLALVGIVASLFGATLLGIVKSGTVQSPVFAIVSSTLGTGLALLLYPPILLVLAFQYFNLVERREGVGLRSLVGQLGQAAPTARNASYRPEEEGEY